MKLDCAGNVYECSKMSVISIIVLEKDVLLTVMSLYVDIMLI